MNNNPIAVSTVSTSPARSLWAQLLVASVVAVLFTVANLFLVLNNQRRIVDSSTWVRHTEAVLLQLSTLLSVTKDVETGVRGYVITDDARYLEPYNRGVPLAHMTLDTLAALTADNPEQKKPIATLREILEINFSNNKQLIELQREKDRDEASSLLETGAQKRRMDEFREQIEKMQVIERALLVTRSANVEQTIQSTLVTGVLSNVLGLLAICALLLLYTRYLASRAADTAMMELQAEQLRTSLQSLSDGVITVDRAGRITQMNDRAAQLSGKTLAHALGQPIRSELTLLDSVSGDEVPVPITTTYREPQRLGPSGLMRIEAANDGQHLVEVELVTIQSVNGDATGTVITLREKTEAIRLRNALDRTMRRVSAALLANEIGVWECDPVSGMVFCDSNVSKLLSLDAQMAMELPGSKLLKSIRRTDRVRVIKALRQCIADGPPIGLVCKVENATDGTLWIEIRGRCRLLDENESAHVYGVIIDVTERIELTATTQRLTSIIDQSPDFIGILDHELTPSYLNPAAAAMLGVDRVDELPTHGGLPVVSPASRQKLMTDVAPSLLQDGSAETSLQFKNLRTGNTTWVECRIFKLANEDGRSLEFGIISRDIEQRRRMEQDLRKLSVNLTEENHSKNVFLAILAHELRNPLSPMRSAVELLDLGGLDPEELPRITSILRRQVAQMERLVDDLLDIGRIAQNKIELQLKPAGVLALVSEALEASRESFRNKRHKIVVDLPQKDIVLSIDRARIVQVLCNLLNNACKFTDPGGQISLSVKALSKELVICVRDNGRGIPSDKQESVFEMFTQAPHGPDCSISGLGIGLSLCRTLMSLHDGHIDMTSDGAGKGCEVTLHLPRPLLPLQMPTDTPNIVFAPAGAQRILLVDDNEDSVSLMSRLLLRVGYLVEGTHDGQSALESFEKFSPDVVVLDIGLPGITGYEVATRIRSMPGGADVMLVALTGWGDAESCARTAAAGFDAHLVKPISIAELLKTIASVDDSDRVPGQLGSEPYGGQVAGMASIARLES